MHVREAREDDVDDLLYLGEQVGYAELSWKHVKFSREALKQTVEFLTAGSSGACLILEHDKQLVGFALMFFTRYFFSYEKYASDVTYYVHPEHRKGSAGVKLIRAMIARAREEGVKELLLSVNSGFNMDRTRKLIERLGGAPLGQTLTVRF